MIDGFDNGIYTITHKNSGPIVTLVACTHGDELSGYEAFKYLLNDFELEKKLKNGTLNLIIGNLKGCVENKRYIDTDFNRVWDFDSKNRDTYEFHRAKEIMSYLINSDYLFDLHSTTNPSPLFLIPGVKNLSTSHLNADFKIFGILEILHGLPLISYASNKNSNLKSLVMEVHDASKKDFELYLNNIISYLNEIGVIQENLPFERSKKSTEELHVTKACYAESLDIEFLYSSSPQSFDMVKKGEKIYRDGDNIITAEEDYYLLMPTKPRYIGEEILYLLKN